MRIYDSSLLVERADYNSATRMTRVRIPAVGVAEFRCRKVLEERYCLLFVFLFYFILFAYYIIFFTKK